MPNTIINPPNGLPSVAIQSWKVHPVTDSSTIVVPPVNLPPTNIKLSNKPTTTKAGPITTKPTSRRYFKKHEPTIKPISPTILPTFDPSMKHTWKPNRRTGPHFTQKPTIVNRFE